MYKLQLCLRYLRTRWIALASIISVMLGVATMIVVNSVMAGFATEMRERIHGILADIVVETHTLDGDPDAAARMQEIQEVAGNYVEAMTATVEVYGMISFKYRGQVITRPVTLIGIDPETKGAVSPLVTNLTSFTSGRRMGLALEDDAVSGCRVAGVLAGSPADASGIHAGDRITGCNGTAIQDTRELASQLKDTVDRRTLDLDINRDGQSLTLTLPVPRPSWDLPADAREHRRAIVELERRRLEWTQPQPVVPAGGTRPAPQPTPPDLTTPPGSPPRPQTPPPVARRRGQNKDSKKDLFF